MYVYTEHNTHNKRERVHDKKRIIHIDYQELHKLLILYISKKTVIEKKDTKVALDRSRTKVSMLDGCSAVKYIHVHVCL